MTGVTPSGGSGALAGLRVLTGHRVLVPRATEGPDPLVIALVAAGAEPVVVPLIQTLPPDDLTELDDVLLAVQAGYYGWVGLTSTTVVPVLCARAEAAGTDLPQLLAKVRVAAVGGSTARAVRSAGVTVDVVPTGPSSASTLLRVWPPVDGQPEPRRVLLPQGDLAADTLADGLTAFGWPVDTVVAYRTVSGPPPAPAIRTEWENGAIDAVLLTSGSTARGLRQLLGPVPAGTRVIAIGSSTAREAAHLGVPVTAIAAEQSPSGLVTALAMSVVESTANPSADSPLLDVTPDPHPITDGEPT